MHQNCSFRKRVASLYHTTMSESPFALLILHVPQPPCRPQPPSPLPPLNNEPQPPSPSHSLPPKSTSPPPTSPPSPLLTNTPIPILQLFPPLSPIRGRARFRNSRLRCSGRSQIETGQGRCRVWVVLGCSTYTTGSGGVHYGFATHSWLMPGMASWGVLDGCLDEYERIVYKRMGTLSLKFGKWQRGLVSYFIRNWDIKDSKWIPIFKQRNLPERLPYIQNPSSLPQQSTPQMEWHPPKCCYLLPPESC